MTQILMSQSYTPSNHILSAIRVYVLEIEVYVEIITFIELFLLHQYYKCLKIVLFDVHNLEYFAYKYMLKTILVFIIIHLKIIKMTKKMIISARQ